MPKIIPALTNTAVKNAKPSDKLITVFDGMETGLHVIIQPTGTKTFRLKVKINGTDKRITIGHYPETALAEAREKAGELKKQIKAGIDPTAPVKPVIENTFELVAEKFVNWKASVLLRSGSTIRKYRECLNNDLLPEIGKMDIVHIHASDVVPLLEKIEKRSNSQARKNLELINMVIKYAVQRGYRPPYTQIDLTGIIVKKKSKPKTIPSDIQKTYKKIDEYDEVVMCFAMKIQFLCFLRSSETMGTPWSEINLDAKEWWIGKERMKMNRIHIVPLSSQLIELLQQLKEITGESDFLFPSKHKESHMHRDALSKAFRTCKLGIVPHGCRTAAGTWMRNNGFAPHLVKAQLSHVEENEVEAAYIDRPHLMYLDERHKMMQAWSDHLFSAKT